VCILIALVCAELVRAESSRGKVEETQNNEEAAQAKLLLEQMKHSTRNAEGVASILSNLSTVLSKLESRTSTLVSDMSTVKSDLTSVNSAVATVKSSVKTLKSKQVYCLSGWSTITGADAKVITYSTAFSASPAVMAAFNKLDKIGNLKYLWFEGTSTTITVHLGDYTADQAGDNEFTWMACGHRK